MDNNDTVPKVDQLHVLKGIRALDYCRRYEQLLMHPFAPASLIFDRLFPQLKSRRTRN